MSGCGGLLFDGWLQDNYQNLISIQANLQTISTTNYSNFDFSLTPSDQKIYDDDLQEVIPSDARVKVNTSGPNSNLLVGIDSIVPPNVAAGVIGNLSQSFNVDTYSGIITIHGSGFGDLIEGSLSGDIPSNNRVEFDATGIGLAANLKITPFASDYLKWDDDEIIVRVPGIGYLIQAGVLIPDVLFGATATSGNVSVVSPATTFNSPEPVTVHFAQWNYFSGTSMPAHVAKRTRLKALDDYANEANGLAHDNDGGEFYFTPMFLDSMPVGSDVAVADALETWRCNSRVNFEIVPQADIVDITLAGALDYGETEVGVIADTWNALSTGFIECDASAPVEDTPIIGHGIIFSDAANFSTTGGVPDVRSVALHEFGHNHTLAHVDITDYIMHIEVSDIDVDLSLGDISGGQHVVSHSDVDITCQAGGTLLSFPGMIPLDPCLIDAVYDINTQVSISLFPNPSFESLNLLSEESAIQRITIYNNSGEIVFVKDLGNNIFQAEIQTDFPSGFYFVKVLLNNGQSLTKKIITIK